MTFVPFADVTGVNSGRIPALTSVGLIALYATGTDGIEATAAEIARFRNVGCGVIMIDQTPSLSVFAAGLADVADVESGAGTYATAAEAVASRMAHGWESTIYISFSALSALKAVLGNLLTQSQVVFGVADYSWSQAESENLLNANPNWAYIQYGDPNSNPNTLVPGTTVNLRQAQADIDIAKASWADQFLAPVIPPPPRPPMPPKVGTGYRWEADGTQSLAQIAAARGATVANLVDISLANLDKKNRARLNALLTTGLTAPLPNGFVYYTTNP